MIKLIKGVAAFSLVTSLIFSSPVYADAALGNKVSIDAVSQMRKAGMTESDIKRIQQHNKDEIEF
ncbi:hypothetical protein [Paenibacillus taiwanensis]|uniref:hypothetical protein n=1 Tax=Paenibacillus taiwanensis TaxID=401638 RepID=UPI00040E4474|nr:hypothetical protein [Paenibacillus taiwanensis]